LRTEDRWDDQMLIAVDAPHFYAGIVLENDIAVEAAPILKWAIGKDRDFLRDYFKKRKWKVTVCRDHLGVKI
jgi:hypothetical protein